MPGVEQLDPAHRSRTTRRCSRSRSADGLLSAAQMNVVEFHTWNAREDRHRQARPHDLRPRPGRRRELAADAGGGAAGARLPRRAGPAGLPQDQRRQGPARGRAAEEAVRLGHGQGLLAGDRAAPGAHHPAALRRQERRQQPGRQDLHRLPAQRLRRDHRVRLVGARRGPGLGISVPVRWDELERPQERRALDGGHRAHPARRRQRALGRLRGQPSRPGRGHEGAGLPAG